MAKLFWQLSYFFKESCVKKERVITANTAYPVTSQPFQCIYNSNLGGYFLWN